MRKICLLASVAIVAAVGIALGSHEKDGADSDRARGDTWQTWATVTPNYRQMYPVLFPQPVYKPVRLVRATHLHKPVAVKVPLPRPRPALPALEHLAANPLKVLFGGF